MSKRNLRQTIHVPVPECQSSFGTRLGSGTRIRPAPSPEAQLDAHRRDLEDLDPEMDVYDIMMRQLPNPFDFEND